MEQLPLPSDQQAEPAYDEFSRNWDEEVAKEKGSGKQPKLMKVRAIPQHLTVFAVSSEDSHFVCRESLIFCNFTKKLNMLYL